MSTEREPLSELEKLKSQAESYSSAASYWEETAQNIGSEQGSAYLNYREVEAPKRIGRIRLAARVRELITTDTITYFREQVATINQQIERKSAIAGVQADLLEIRRLHVAGFATPEMVEDAEKEYEALVVSVFTSTPPEITPQAPIEGPVETPVVPTPEKEKLVQIELYLDEQRVVTDGREKKN